MAGPNGTYGKPTAKVILNGDRLKTSPKGPERDKDAHPLILFNIVLAGLATAIKQEKGTGPSLEAVRLRSCLLKIPRIPRKTTRAGR
jgi:hypothetical protein